MSTGSVGRPKKRSIARAIPSVIIPCDEVNKKIQLGLKNILILKQFMHVVKDISWYHIYIRFENDTVILYAKDKSENVHIMAQIYQTSMDIYKYSNDVPLTIQCNY